MIFFSAWASIFYGKTFTSFSMFRGLGRGNPMIHLKKSSLSALDLDTVNGRNPSKLRRTLFFSSTVKRTPTSASKRYIVSTLVTKHSFFSFHQMQLMVILLVDRSSGATTLK